MKDFDYIIIGGGCAGLSLAYELEIKKKLKNKTLAIIDNRTNYNRDKTWSFWKVNPHNFDDCVIKNWKDFSINIPNKTNYVNCARTPYQSIDSGLFYKKIFNRLEKNQNIKFLKTINDVNVSKSLIFNSLHNIKPNKNDLWQHFAGEQKNSVHFFYTLPYSKSRALVETTWLSNMMDETEKNYDDQLKNYIEKNLNIKNYKILYEEQGKIPLFHPPTVKNNNEISIGTAGGMTRLSTGYTFLNIQEHSKYICNNLEKINKVKKFEIKKKYKFLDKIFLKVLSRHPQRMPEIFYNMFTANNEKVINFLSNKSNVLEDISIILKMPKLLFLRELI